MRIEPIKHSFIPPLRKGAYMDNKEYNDDVYLEPTIELDDASAVAPQEIKVQICTTGC
jgi:hypothetical protein